jgi:hypothetical protein
MAGAIKGSAIEALVADVNRLLEQGRLSRDQLEARLAREDLALLEEKVLAAVWYPLDSYARLTQVLLDVEGHGDVGYLHERGRRVAQRLRDSGIYSQFARSRDELETDRFGRLMVTLGPAMYRDTEWIYRPDPQKRPGYFEIEARVPREFPDVGRYPSQGFIECLGNADAPYRISVTSERKSPTLLLFVSRRS